MCRWKQPAMELPVVATRVTGCVNAVLDGQTGTLVPPRDATALADAIGRYLADADLRRAHGAAGRARVLAEFSPQRVWEALHQECVELLRERGLPVPHLRNENAYQRGAGNILSKALLIATESSAAI